MLRQWLKRLGSWLTGHKPLSEEEAWDIYMQCARHQKPAGLFAIDFVRAVEKKHGIE